MSSHLEPIYICGATATGKTSTALKTASVLNGEIINADAFQIYKGIEVIAATPNEQELSQQPHHLFSHFSLEEELNAAKYRLLALEKIQEVQSRQRVPIITGGSGLYLKFLTHGPSEIPASDPQLREALDARDLPSLIEELSQLDPEVLETFPNENKRYVVRALEICLLSGKKASSLKKAWENSAPPNVRGILVNPTKEETLRNIEQRTWQMLQNGGIQEVETLLNKEDHCPTAKKAIGVKEIKKHLNAEYSLEECHERICISTRQYAKRQRTWFRKEQWLKPFHPNDSLEQLLAELGLT